MIVSLFSSCDDSKLVLSIDEFEKGMDIEGDTIRRFLLPFFASRL
jgi:hypothetical protein